MNIFKIYIKDFKIDVIIGILDKERKNKQKIIVNAEIEYDLDEHFLDYVQALEVIKNLLEYKKYEIISIKLKIDKPEVFKNTLLGVENIRRFQDMK